MRFHTRWHQLTNVDTWGDKESPGAGAFDVNCITINGQEVYVGDTLTLDNDVARWWGEGDENIFVDGKALPSHFGTDT